MKARKIRKMYRQEVTRRAEEDVKQLFEAHKRNKKIIFWLIVSLVATTAGNIVNIIMRLT